MILVQRLRELQDHHGYLPEQELRQLSADTGIPLPKIQEVISFFAHFRAEYEKPPYVEVKVCRDMTCFLKGAPQLVQELKKLERSDDDRPVVVEGVSCLGRCDRAPVVTVSRHTEHAHEHIKHDANHELQMMKLHGNPFGENDPEGSFHEWVYAAWDKDHKLRSATDIRKIVENIISGGRATIPDWDFTYKLHRNNVETHPDNSEWQIDPYVDAADHYSAVREFLTKFPKPIQVPQPPIGPDGKPTLKGDDLRKWTDKAIADAHPWLMELKKAGLLGMGGAGVPAFIKWQEVWKAAGDEKYIVTNGDESEPGTFKDRELLLRKPHLVIEGVLLAGLMTNATRGFIFIRHEYPEQIRAVRTAIRKAREMGACGENIFGSKRNFDVDVFVSPGGYICGEQSALLEAMEDRRAQPRNRPPELMTNGLRDKPTVVNNVETLSWAPAVFRRGGQWYQDAAVGDFKGRRFFSISGDLVRPGVYEVKVSDTLGDLIKMAGGMMRINGDKRATLKAACTSGPSGGFLPVLIPVSPALHERVKTSIEDRDRADDKKFLMEMVRAGLRVYGDLKQEIDLPKEVGPFIQKIQELEAAGQRFVYDLRKLPLDLNLFKAIGKLIGVGMSKTAGMMLGAGIVIYSQEGMPRVLDHALNHTEFFRNESCGKCVPCRLGSQKLVQIGTDILDGAKRKSLTLVDTPTQLGLKSQADLIRDMSFAMMMTSICSLGQVAASPLMTAFQYFSHELPLAEKK